MSPFRASLARILLLFFFLGAVSTETASAGTSAPAGAVGIEERLGGFVPLDAVFRDETGARVALGRLIRTPTILALVYYRCPNACDYLLTGMASAVRTLQAAPGKDYRVITISIDETETPGDARRAKGIALEAVEGPFPPNAWRFLTGDAADIQRVARAVGFHFVRRGSEFDHPVGIVILSPRGKIVRYMNGADFLPADLKLSLMEASAGRIGPTIAKLLRFCFTTDPKSHQLVFNLLRIVGSVTILGAGLLVAFLALASWRRRRADP